MKKLGFTFLELIIGITISAIISITLYMSFTQTQRSSRNLERIISVDTRIMILQNQLERDVSGVFAPHIEEEKVEQGFKNINEEKQKAEKSKQKLSKTFFSENQGKNINELTFITCNPLQIYGQATPRIVRVTYKLKSSKDLKDAYSLFRQESLDLNYKAQAIEYELTDNIKELSFEYTVQVKEKENKEKLKDIKEEQKKQKPKQYKTFDSWNFDGSNKENPYMIPLYVKVKVTLWEDNLHTREQAFEFKYEVYAFDSQIPRKSKGQRILERVMSIIPPKKPDEGSKDDGPPLIPPGDKK